MLGIEITDGWNCEGRGGFAVYSFTLSYYSTTAVRLDNVAVKPLSIAAVLSIRAVIEL